MENSLIINGHVFEFKPGQTFWKWPTPTISRSDTMPSERPDAYRFLPDLCGGNGKGPQPDGRLLYACGIGHGRKNRYQVKANRFSNIPSPYLPEMKNPLIVRDFSRCILCGRCVQACNMVWVCTGN